MRGTLLNTAAVLVGATMGLTLGGFIHAEYQVLTQAAIGIGVIGMGIKLSLESKNVLIPVGSLILGVLFGHLIGIQNGVEALGSAAKGWFGDSSGTFESAFVTPSLLFCVGPMTLLGCLEDGLEGKIELLGLKSILDGVSALFFAATLGPGVLLSAVTVFVVQAPLTLAAKQLAPLRKKPYLLAEISATGGLILMVIGLNLLGVTKLPSADFIPALLFAGLSAKFFAR